MTVNNISTFASLQNLLQNVAHSQGLLNNDQVAISSGQKSQTFDGLGGSVEQLTTLNAQVSRLTDFNQNNSVVVNQLQASNTALGQVQQTATSIQSLIASQLSGTFESSAAFQQQLHDDLATITASLNTTFEGNFLFSGTATNTAPVKTPPPAPAQIGVPDNSYYQGSGQNSTTRISDGQSITNGVRADDPAFQKIFAGVAQALQSGASTDDLKHAEDLIASGIQGVIALQASVNGNIVNLQNVTTENQTLQTYFKGLSQTLTQSDVVALSTQVAQDQTVLEASFSTYARISSLSLANFLK